MAYQSTPILSITNQNDGGITWFDNGEPSEISYILEDGQTIKFDNSDPSALSLILQDGQMISIDYSDPSTTSYILEDGQTVRIDNSDPSAPSLMLEDGRTINIDNGEPSATFYAFGDNLDIVYKEGVTNLYLDSEDSLIKQTSDGSAIFYNVMGNRIQGERLIDTEVIIDPDVFSYIGNISESHLDDGTTNVSVDEAAISVIDQIYIDTDEGRITIDDVAVYDVYHDTSNSWFSIDRPDSNIYLSTGDIWAPFAGFDATPDAQNNHTVTNGDQTYTLIYHDEDVITVKDENGDGNTYVDIQSGYIFIGDSAAGENNYHATPDTEDLFVFDLESYHQSVEGGVLTLTHKTESGDINQFANFKTLNNSAIEYDHDTQALASLYDDIFGRQADLDGLQDYYGEVQGGNSLGDVALTFMNSSEYSNMSDKVAFNNLNTENQIHELYNTLLHRDADQGGFDYWLGEANNGTSMSEIAASFVASDEYVETFKAVDEWAFTV